MWGCRIPTFLMQQCPLTQAEGLAVALLPPPNFGVLIPAAECKTSAGDAEGLSGLSKHGCFGKAPGSHPRAHQGWGQGSRSLT